ncbi:hypothetical protein [Bradyrhizobium yuanmingense]|uniref:hypothetical protein n=1 Tax=Bradyrhizobium yuanmingense TaxID=108015 RepID=UPI001FD06EF5|nr:hypothetical protein [Bradyrhizobium yuanmingense]
MGGEALGETFREHKADKAKRGKTVSEIIDERIAWMKAPVAKPDGEIRPRLEAWEETARHLDRFVRPRLGKKLPGEVTKRDIAQLSDDIVAGRFGLPSVSNARHMRKAASVLSNWAAEPPREYVTASPCINLPKLDPEPPAPAYSPRRRERSGFSGAASTAMTCHGTARLDSPSNSSWSPCCAPANC